MLRTVGYVDTRKPGSKRRPSSVAPVVPFRPEVILRIRLVDCWLPRAARRAGRLPEQPGRALGIGRTPARASQAEVRRDLRPRLAALVDRSQRFERAATEVLPRGVITEARSTPTPRRAYRPSAAARADTERYDLSARLEGLPAPRTESPCSIMGWLAYPAASRHADLTRSAASVTETSGRSLMVTPRRVAAPRAHGARPERWPCPSGSAPRCR